MRRVSLKRAIVKCRLRSEQSWMVLLQYGHADNASCPLTHPAEPRTGLATPNPASYMMSSL